MTFLFHLQRTINDDIYGNPIQKKKEKKNAKWWWWWSMYFLYITHQKIQIYWMLNHTHRENHVHDDDDVVCTFIHFRSIISLFLSLSYFIINSFIFHLYVFFLIFRWFYIGFIYFFFCSREILEIPDLNVFYFDSMTSMMLCA